MLTVTSRCLQTRVNGDVLNAKLTRHPTTPLQRTVTVLLGSNNSRRVASPAAHDIASVHRRRPRTADAIARAQRAVLPVVFTVARRRFRVDEVLDAVRFHVVGGGQEARAVVRDRHDRRAVVESLQTTSDVTKYRKLSPAGLQRAGSGQTVALADRPHVVPHRLWDKSKQCRSLVYNLRQYNTGILLNFYEILLRKRANLFDETALQRSSHSLTMDFDRLSDHTPAR